MPKRVKLIWKEKDFTAEDIEDAFLVIAATNQPEINLLLKMYRTPSTRYSGG